MPDLTELRLLLEEATPGPWEFDSLGEDEPEVNAWTHRFIGNTTPDENGHYQIIATTEDGHGPNARLIAAAVNALPELLDAAEALERVKALHYEVVVYELDPANGYAVYEDGERKVLARFCAECSSVDLIDAIEDQEYRQGWDYGRAVDHPCSTIRAADGEPQP